VNERLYTSNHGLRLITQFEGAPRLKARLCEGNRHELSYGVTFHIDGRPVEAGETCTEDYAMAMFRNALGTFEEAVKRHVTVELTQFQFDALVSFAYNVGEANFASSTVLKETNARRFEDAAAAFSMWIFATRDGWKQAYRGLLRRRLAEATLYLGYDWVQATSDDAIALQKLPPPGNPPKGSDRVTYKTPFLEVLRVAQHYPLSEPVDTWTPIPVPSPDLSAEIATAPLPDSAIAIPLPGDELVLRKPAPIPQASNPGVSPPGSTVSDATAPRSSEVVASAPAPQSPLQKPVPGQGTAGAPDAPPVVVGPPPKLPPVIAPKTINIDAIPYGQIAPENGAKNMTDSKRGLGMVIVGLGSVVQILAGREIVSSTVGAVFFDMSRDPVLVALIVGAIFMAVGWITRKRGTKIMTDGMKNATQVLK